MSQLIFFLKSKNEREVSRDTKKKDLEVGILNKYTNMLLKHKKPDVNSSQDVQKAFISEINESI